MLQRFMILNNAAKRRHIVPNIEIRGFDKPNADLIKKGIMAALVGKSYEKDYVITTEICEVTDCDNKRQPFIRLVTTEQPHNGELIEILHSFRLDVEYLKLEAFCPKN